MLIFDNRKFIQAPFESEDELEQVVVENSEYIFGPSSIYLSKSLITTPSGTGTIPDGFVIDLEGRRWYIVEAEISRHSVWSHIAPQVAKQIIAASNPATKRMLIDLASDRVKEDELLQQKFSDEGIHTIDVRRVLSDIVAGDPIIGMPIDAVKSDLREWAATLKVDVKLWIVRKYVEFTQPANVMYEIPEEFRPVLDTTTNGTQEQTKSRYDVSMSDLLDAGFLDVGTALTMPYKPRNGEHKTYSGVILDDGSIELLGKVFSSPSYAALSGMQDAGSNRRTVNGWTAWRTEAGELLSEVRDRFLQSLNESAQ